LDKLFFTVVHILVGAGHMESDRCTECSFFSSSSSSDVRRKSFHPLYGSHHTYKRSMYDRGVKDLPPRPEDGLRYRVETLVGITGFKMAKYRTTWIEAVSAPFRLIWCPHLLCIMVFEVLHYS
jgi:hypothetical protein